jgi:mannose-6-phosphate isomerase-like protein (cupin superfamily)
VSLNVFEIYTHEESGARIDTHPWFYRDGKQMFGLTRIFPPHTGKGLPHVHAGVEQRNTVRHGVARYRIGKAWRELEPGEELVIPAGTPHLDPYNDTGGALEMTTLFSPGPMYLFHYARTLGQAIRDGNVNSQQEFKLLHLMVMLNQPGGSTYAAGPPISVQRLFVIPLMATLGRLRGYRPAYGFGIRDLRRPRDVQPSQSVT